MIPAKVTKDMRCSECGNIIDACSNCFVIFDEGEKILCEDEKTGSHYCLRCKE